jgi:hypothetical protein
MTEQQRLQWEVAHMGAWADLERAKGRPESNLTWGNCIHETGVLVEDAHGRQIINPHRGTLVPLPGDWIV